MNTKNFAQRFKELRLRKGWTQEEMATELGIGAKYLGMIETGKKEVEEDGSLGKLFMRLEADTFGKAAQSNVVIVSARSGGSAREKLRAMLQEKQISPAQLAKRIKYDSGIVENVVNGTGRISEKMADSIVTVLDGGLTKEDLLDGSETPTIIDREGFEGTFGMRPTAPGRQWAPKIAWAAAGNLKNAAALDEAWDGTAVDTDVKGRVMSVDIEGDSMYPEINPGDTAIVRVDVEARPGQIVLVRTVHGDVWCKRYSTKDGNRFAVFSSVNNTYEPIEVPAEDIAWIYPVKQVIRNYK